MESPRGEELHINLITPCELNSFQNSKSLHLDNVDPNYRNCSSSDYSASKRWQCDIEDGTQSGGSICFSPHTNVSQGELNELANLSVYIQEEQAKYISVITELLKEQEYIKYTLGRRNLLIKKYKNLFIKYFPLFQSRITDFKNDGIQVANVLLKKWNCSELIKALNDNNVSDNYLSKHCIEAVHSQNENTVIKPPELIQHSNFSEEVGNDIATSVNSTLTDLLSMNNQDSKYKPSPRLGISFPTESGQNAEAADKGNLEKTDALNVKSITEAASDLSNFDCRVRGTFKINSPITETVKSAPIVRNKSSETRRIQSYELNKPIGYLKTAISHNLPMPHSFCNSYNGNIPNNYIKKRPRFASIVQRPQLRMMNTFNSGSRYVSNSGNYIIPSNIATPDTFQKSRPQCKRIFHSSRETNELKGVNTDSNSQMLQNHPSLTFSSTSSQKSDGQIFGSPIPLHKNTNNEMLLNNRLSTQPNNEMSLFQSRRQFSATQSETNAISFKGTAGQFPPARTIMAPTSFQYVQFPVMPQKVQNYRPLCKTHTIINSPAQYPFGYTTHSKRVYTESSIKSELSLTQQPGDTTNLTSNLQKKRVAPTKTTNWMDLINPNSHNISAPSKTFHTKFVPSNNCSYNNLLPTTYSYNLC